MEVLKYKDNQSLWVFGYGSLCWHPGFETKSSAIGYVTNYVRKFWQGNTTHRGRPGKPGRVATLVEERNGTTWGVAYEVTGEPALQYLNGREVTLGGYRTEITSFYPKDSSLREPFPVLLYIATSSSKDWAGPAPLRDIATQITGSHGPVGHNIEYLLRLADFMREKVPEGYDEHLATLESLVRCLIKENNICLNTVMGNNKKPYSQRSTSPDIANGNNPAINQDEQLDVNNVEGLGEIQENIVNNNQNEPQERRPIFRFSAQLPKKKLRCLNV